MLELKIESREYFDDYAGEFVTLPPVHLKLEHCLYAIAKWEERYKKPFISSEQKTPEEMNYYIKCMSLEPITMDTIDSLGDDVIELINKYIEDTRTVTVSKKRVNDGRRSIYKKSTISSIDMYYWIVALELDWEVEHWHLSRFMALVDRCKEANSRNSGKKPSQKEIMMQNAKLNEARRKASGSRG